MHLFAPTACAALALSAIVMAPEAIATPVDGLRERALIATEDIFTDRFFFRVCDDQPHFHVTIHSREQGHSNVDHSQSSNFPNMCRGPVRHYLQSWRFAVDRLANFDNGVFEGYPFRFPMEMKVDFYMSKKVAVESVFSLPPPTQNTIYYTLSDFASHIVTPARVKDVFIEFVATLKTTGLMPTQMNTMYVNVATIEGIQHFRFEYFIEPTFTVFANAWVDIFGRRSLDEMYNDHRSFVAEFTDMLIEKALDPDHARQVLAEELYLDNLDSLYMTDYGDENEAPEE